MNVQTLDATGKKGTQKVNDAVFGVSVNQALLAQAIRVYLSNKRQGTSKVQTRSQVTRSKSKIYRQKGTGNARHGSKNAPLFVGGGVAHGPTGTENWNRGLSQKMKQVALVSALSAQQKNIVIIDQVAELTGKTQQAAALFKPLESKHILVVVAASRTETERALRNMPTVTLVTAQQVNALEVARAHTVVLTTEAVKILEQRLTRVDKAKDKAKKATTTTTAQKNTAAKPAKKTATKTKKKAKK